MGIGLNELAVEKYGSSGAPAAVSSRGLDETCLGVGGGTALLGLGLRRRFSLGGVLSIMRTRSCVRNGSGDVCSMGVNVLLLDGGSEGLRDGSSMAEEVTDLL